MIGEKSRAEEERRRQLLDARTDRAEWRQIVASLLAQWVILLAMKNGQAPLPVPPALRKGLVRHGFPRNLDELGFFARRYLYLKDARMMLAELGTLPHVFRHPRDHSQQPESKLEQRDAGEG